MVSINKKILIIGDSCKDIFIYGKCDRLNLEAPVPIFVEKYRIENDGMAGNVYTHFLKFGFPDIIITFKTQNESILKIRYVEEKSNYILLRVDYDNIIKPITKEQLPDISKFDITIISDYNKGFLTTDIIEYILKKSKLSFIDTKKPIDKWINNATFIKINESEYNNPLNNFKYIKELKEKLIITHGKNGAVYNDKIYEPVKHTFVRDVVGAGDTFLASLASHYLLYNNIEEAIKFANICSAQVVSKRGVAYPDEKLL